MQTHPSHLIAGLLAASAMMTSVCARPEPPHVRTLLDLEAHAAQLAREDYVPPVEDLDPFFAGLQYDDHRRIQFRKDQTLFVQEAVCGVELFHPGWMFKKPVGFTQIANGQPSPIPFARSLFDYFGLEVPKGTKDPSGFSGFRLTALGLKSGQRPEFMAFQGASYFRAVPVGNGLGWGTSARALAINTVGGEKEEFPDFTHFWFKRPSAGEKSFSFLALLDGPSVTGAYEFTVQPGEATVVGIKATLYLRRPVKLLGLAPFSSMFWFGENTQPRPTDFRLEVHDADGLLIEQEHAPTLWRPLDNGREMRHSVFVIDHLKGFGLQQRDREGGNYEDLEALYHQRTAVWVEPVEGFGRGNLHLIELPTGEETWDNVVTLWEPDNQPATGKPMRFAYNLHWEREHLHALGKVTSTRQGQTPSAAGQPPVQVFVVDFSKGSLVADKPPGWSPACTVHVANGLAKVLSQTVIANPHTGGWRCTFTLFIPPSTSIAEFACDLLDGDRPVTERWNYQWRR